VRYFFETSYFGQRYSGWQSQANALGIQTVLEQTLSAIFRSPVRIVGSGRTDAGVHCEQQFFHTDINRSFDPEQLQTKLNSFLPPDIAIGAIRQVRDDAHARYSATSRTYEYRISLEKNPFLNGMALRWFKPLDIQTMGKATALIVGTHDFTAFSKVKTDVNHFICEIKTARWKFSGSLLTFQITADRFLRGMVRALTGTLLDVGTGKTTLSEFKSIIRSKDRKKAGANVAPYGLYLTKVTYPRTIFMEKKTGM
jgi:tRNA pseudouridine38-40 synthase